MKKLSKILFVGLILTQFASPCSAARDAYIPDKYKGIILYAPEPDIPAVGYSNNQVFGTGVYRLVVNQKTGMVDEVKVLNPIGWKRIDASAIWILFKWKF